MKLHWLLFDIDNTLLDFNGAIKNSFWKSFESYDLECNDEFFAIYKKINHKAWTDFERGLISAEKLQYRRWALLFEKIGVTHVDAKEFSINILNNLVTCSYAYDGVIEMLQKLRPHFKMSMVTNGLKEVQRARIEKLNMSHFFDSIIVSDDIGVSKPDARFFDYAYKSIDFAPDKSECMVIGDNPVSDIQGAIDFGFRTCWVRDHWSHHASVKPDFIVNSVVDILGHL